MRVRKVPRCPRCGDRMAVHDGRERTVAGGTWYELQCPRCLYVSDLFWPKRGKPTKSPSGEGREGGGA